MCKRAELAQLEEENRQLKEKEQALQYAINTIEISLSFGSLMKDYQQEQQQQQQQLMPARSAADVSQQAADESPAGSDATGRPNGEQPGAQAQLYTSQLLAKSASDPAQAAAFVAFDTKARIDHYKQHMLQIGVFMPKYDNPDGMAKQRVDAALDKIIQGILTWSLLDPKRHTSAVFLNMDTLQHEAYPKGLYEHAAEVGLCAAGGQRGSRRACMHMQPR